MAKKKTNIMGKSRTSSRKRSWRRKLFRFIFSPLLWGLILLALVAAVIYYQRQPIAWWAQDTISGALRFFGWGLVFIVIAIGTIGWVIWRRKVSVSIRRWNYWLGSIAFALAVWGILAYFPAKGVLTGVSLGGFAGYAYFGDILRITGLVILGVILVAPKACWHLVTGVASWLGRQMTDLRVPRLPRQRKLPQPSVTVPPSVPIPPRAVPVETEEPEKTAVAPALVPTPAQQELKQVAQDVWKKYGESTSLVVVDGWKLPPIDILDLSPEVQFSQADNLQRAKLIEEALASYGVEAKVAQINAGPTVTQFGLEPGWDRKMKEIRERDRDGNVTVRLEETSKTRVKVDRISSLANDLALALAAPSIRIEAPVPGKSVVGIEVPNTVASLVSLRGVIETSVFQKMRARSKISLALGKGAGGEAVSADLARMPHLLVAGATGSGKTVCLDSIICCLLLSNTPNDVRFIMIDPKRVELTVFNSIPHLVAPVIVDTEKALDALRWLSEEMNKRYQTLASAGIRNIESYNKNKQGEEKMPYLVLLIDELADLMMTGGDEVERILCRLAQLARAVGIHLVVATQRPSVDVITGLIKANFPTRISFAVTSQVDSRTILDGGGAEKLLGRGDMLYMPTEAGKPKRLQGCYVSDAEVERLVYFWGSQKKEDAAQLKVEELIPSIATTRKGGYPEDSLLETARQLAEEHKHISTSFLQRRLHIGYPRAARIMEQLEEERDEGEEGQSG